ncbi:Golgi-associated plant pathogenesis-related protein 1-like [Ixodes scapularis]|uniref:Golgi-associated plant pathogenesis-related protein 1-like n=1 Tax=Ixodes scapularis TaxID=6945 RepID=UPI001A9E9A01|nr:Golgi-associated plant pathogenesis-related protein 1-like [Ixodes scapularis]
MYPRFVTRPQKGRRIVHTKTIQRSVTRKRTLTRPDGSQEVVEEEVVSPRSREMLPKDRPLSDAEFQRDSLNWHNYYRSLHGVPPLQLSAELNAMAKAWATKLATEDRFEHSPGTDHGENIYVKWSSDTKHQITGREAVESWYSEISEYHWDGGEPDIDITGHFTQLIWKETTHLGCAQARGATHKILVVANYSPPGNVIGKFASCVPPLLR